MKPEEKDEQIKACARAKSGEKEKTSKETERENEKKNDSWKTLVLTQRQNTHYPI